MKELLFKQNNEELFGKTFRFQTFFRKFPLPLAVCPLVQDP